MKPMNSKIIYKGTLKKRQSLISYEERSISSQRSQINNRQSINQLYSKYLQLNSQVQIQHDLSAFNMMEFEPENKKIQFDQQMVIAKLKRLQNNAELNRLNMELEHRMKKNHRSKNKQQQFLPAEQSYLKTYQHLTERKQNIEFQKRDMSDSEDEQGAQSQKVEGIHHYNELKKHPKLLDYTLQKVRSKQLIQRQRHISKIIEREQFKNQIKTISHNFQTTKKKSKIKSSGVVIIDLSRIHNKKIYTKKNKDNAAEARGNPRLKNMVDKQDSILDHLDERSLSKENYKKLKDRFNSIIHELYKEEKKHMGKPFLPIISKPSFLQKYQQ